MPLLETLGMTAANQAVGGAMGLALGGINDTRQLKQNEKLLQQQINANQQMSLYSNMMQKDMWDYTNYENQVKHMKKAGINPALLYGKGGAGGAVTGSGGMAVGSQSAPSGGGEAVAGMGMALQTQQSMASIELMKAQAAKEKAEADRISGYGKDNTMANTELQRMQTEYQKIINKIQGESAENQIATYRGAMIQIELENDILSNQAGINKATFETQVNQIKQNLKNSVKSNQLMGKEMNKIESDIEVNKQMIKESANRMVNLNMNTLFAGWNAETNKLDAITRAKAQMTNEQRLAWDKEVHDISDSTKLTVQTASELLGTVISGSMKKPNGGITINNK